MKFTPILIADLPEIQGAFLSGRCDAYSTDASALATFRFSQGPKAADLVLLPDIISKEPLGVMVRKGDDKWFDLVRWTFAAMITAEEKGITSKNIDTFMELQGSGHPPPARRWRATWARRSGWIRNGPTT